MDLAQVHQQLPVTPVMATVLTRYTLKGLYKVRCLPFGVAAATAIFQRWFMETTLLEIFGTCVYLDVVSGATMEGHASRLEVVLDSLKTANLQLSHSKCRFAVPGVSFLCYRADVARIHNQGRGSCHRGATLIDLYTMLACVPGCLVIYNRFLEQRVTVAKGLYQLWQKDIDLGEVPASV